LWTDVSRYVFDELGGPAMPSLLTAPDAAAPVDQSHYTGTFERLSVSIAIEPGADGSLTATVTPTGPVAEAFGRPPQTVRLIPLDDRRFVAQATEGAIAGIAMFTDPDEAGRPRYLSFGGRVNRNTAHKI
jgi:hypothetical protein